MAEGTRSHDWKKEVALMLQEMDQKWEQRHVVWQQEAKSRSSQAILELKSLFTGLSLQHNEMATANRVEYYFEAANVSFKNKIKLAALHLDGKAILWHQGYVGMKGVGVYTDWQEYVRGLRARFGIREDQALSFFLFGLNDELQMPVRMFKPQTLVEAYALAKLQEITVAAIQHKSISTARSTYSAGISYNTSNTTTVKPTAVKELPGLLHTPNIPKLPINTTTNPKQPVLTSKELNEKRTKGLCFWCDEKFVPGHKCKKRQAFTMQFRDRLLNIVIRPLVMQIAPSKKY
ncbi:hypothetical protein GH714_020363 [Hevea brasiliensis]|uniref:Retrotransposon gag domain-containing protein n=1 Tax=Hevea brasiliensis TaxID=3981 RepID=A0A6A6LLX8_HEVBR|nr:hypothetical protein GH714_020305 [Hevea brasiliensis]KAF2301142.1 hypothetical protein GH714_020363 [Hevea brasiliensis]